MISKKITINSTSLTNLIFAFFPISFILGNLFINLNLLLFCCFGIFHLRSKILTTEYDFPIKIIFLFFFIIFFSTSLSFMKLFYMDGYVLSHLIRLIKSILFFRFFLMIAIIYLLVQLDILNFKFFFISAALFPILISLDIIYQYFFGFNIIGIERFSTISVKAGRYYSSFFGDELIAGGYVKNFSFFSILFLISKFKNKNSARFILTTVAICILGQGILLSGNRMPVLLFLLGLLLIFFFNDNLKKIIPVSFVGLFIIFYLTFSFGDARYHGYKSLWLGSYHYIKRSLTVVYSDLIDGQKGYGFKQEIEKLIQPNPTVLAGGEDRTIDADTDAVVGDFSSFWHRRSSVSFGNTELFLTALDTWKKNKILGNGIKSFRIDCGRLQEYNINRLCSNHPHNYYVEILTETGVVGLFTASVLGLLFVIFIFKNFRFLRGNDKENLILLASTISLFVEVFPIRSTGSLFSTYNAAYITLIAAIFLSSKKLRKI